MLPFPIVSLVSNMELLYVDKEFLTFDELQKAIQTYEKETNTVLKIVDCRTVNAANKRLQLSTNDIQSYDDKFKYSYIKYACKHYGDYQARGKGTRPNQR